MYIFSALFILWNESFQIGEYTDIAVEGLHLPILSANPYTGQAQF